MAQPKQRSFTERAEAAYADLSGRLTAVYRAAGDKFFNQLVEEEIGRFFADKDFLKTGTLGGSDLNMFISGSGRTFGDLAKTQISQRAGKVPAGKTLWIQALAVVELLLADLKADAGKVTNIADARRTADQA